MNRAVRSAQGTTAPVSWSGNRSWSPYWRSSLYRVPGTTSDRLSRTLAPPYMLSPFSAYPKACRRGTVLEREIPCMSGSSNRTHSMPSFCHPSRISLTLFTRLLLEGVGSRIPLLQALVDHPADRRVLVGSGPLPVQGCAEADQENRQVDGPQPERELLVRPQESNVLEQQVEHDRLCDEGDDWRKPRLPPVDVAGVLPFEVQEDGQRHQRLHGQDDDDSHHGHQSVQPDVRVVRRVARAVAQCEADDDQRCDPGLNQRGHARAGVLPVRRAEHAGEDLLAPQRVEVP